MKPSSQTIILSLLSLLLFMPFLVHLSRRLKCTIVIMRCPSSVRPSSLTFNIFDFSSETAERDSTKLDRKQHLNLLYQVCVFRADRKNKMAALASDWLRHFRLSSETAEWNSTKLGRKQHLNVRYQVYVFWADRKNKMTALASDWLRHFFDFSSETAERN